jgi:hypothetical protein
MLLRSRISLSMTSDSTQTSMLKWRQELKSMSLKADSALRHDVCPKKHISLNLTTGLDLSELDTGLSSSALGGQL